MTEELSQFVRNWVHPDYPPQPFSSVHIRNLETSLKTVFPTDYKKAMMKIGGFSTMITLLDQIVDDELDLFDLSELNSASEVRSETNTWRSIGLPSNLIIIGSDHCGNKFCVQSSKQPLDKSPIYFWDHDFEETELVAESFTEWIAMYNEITAAD